MEIVLAGLREDDRAGAWEDEMMSRRESLAEDEPGWPEPFNRGLCILVIVLVSAGCWLGLWALVTWPR